ncbi:extracellular solute-binding protein [Bacteriovoracales bacterium]|nr:extracellular solute-binding protein [Bacteriovoracales bacterium]
MLKNLLFPLLFLFSVAEVFAAIEIKIIGSTKPKRMNPVLKKFNETVGREKGFRVIYHYDKKFVGKSLKEGNASEIHFDLVQIPDASFLGLAKDQNILMPVESSILEENVPAHLRGKEGTWFGFTKKARVLFYNSDFVAPEEISTYEDLGDPRWEGKVCLRTSESSYNVTLTTFFIEIKGELETKRMLKSWMENRPLIKKSDMSGVLQSLHEGECYIGVANTYYLGHFMKKHKGTPVRVLFPNQNTYGVHINLRSFGIHKNTSHFNFSKLVLEYLTSEEAQDLITQGNEEFGGSFEYPVNPRVKLRGFLKEISNFKENKDFNLEIKNNLGVKAKELMSELDWK